MQAKGHQGVYSVFLNAHGFSDSAGTAGFAQIQVYAYGSNQGIEFRQNNFNNGRPITLESILNRIAQLESTVTELQTQLAAKTNTNSPTFTGKVTNLTNGKI